MVTVQAATVRAARHRTGAATLTHLAHVFSPSLASYKEIYMALKMQPKHLSPSNFNLAYRVS